MKTNTETLTYLDGDKVAISADYMKEYMNKITTHPIASSDLPELPTSRFDVDGREVYTAHQMVNYARTAIASRTAQDSDQNAPWLTTAHVMCTEAGVPQGNILWRLEVLRGLLAGSSGIAASPQLPVAQTEQELPLELAGIAETIEEGGGFWRACSGCHESNEGHPTGPYSIVMQCNLGGGCDECGGIGAIWDNTDYNDMDFLLQEEETTPLPVAQMSGDLHSLAKQAGFHIHNYGNGQGDRIMTGSGDWDRWDVTDKLSAFFALASHPSNAVQDAPVGVDGETNPRILALRGANNYLMRKNNELRAALRYYAEGQHIQVDRTGVATEPYIEQGTQAQRALDASEVATVPQVAQSVPVAYMRSYRYAAEYEHESCWWSWKLVWAEGFEPKTSDVEIPSQEIPLYAAPQPVAASPSIVPSDENDFGPDSLLWQNIDLWFHAKPGESSAERANQVESHIKYLISKYVGATQDELNSAETIIKNLLTCFDDGVGQDWNSKELEAARQFAFRNEVDS